MNAPLFLLDTSVLLTLVRGNELGHHIDARFKLRESKVRPLVSVVTHGEVRVMASRNNWSDARRQALQSALASVVTVDINHPRVFDAYVEIELVSQQRPKGAANMGKNDVWIAACAKAAGATLITLDRDFDHLAPNLLTLEFVESTAART